MIGSDQQLIIPDVSTNVTAPEGDGDLTRSEAGFAVAANGPAIVDVNKETIDTNLVDVPYDLLLDDELNGFFDNEDAISTNTDEGRMGYYLDKNNTKAGTSSNDDRRGTTLAPSDCTSDFPVTTANQPQQVQEQNESTGMKSDFPPISHSEYPNPLENLHNQQSRPTVSCSTNNVAPSNETSTVASKGGNSVLDELNLDDIIIDGVEPTLPWHNEQLDKQHRQAMIRLIVTLLKARKKENPTRVWMVQLPIKARKLERRLYHSAPSLAAYNDRTTLKKRLLDLVRVITVQHQESRTFDNTIAQIQNQQSQPPSLFRGSFRSNRASSVTSQSSIESSSVMSQHQQMLLNRSSFVSTGSIDSLRDLRESVDTKATIESITAKIVPLSRSRANSISSKRSATMGDGNDKSAKMEGTTNDKKLKESTDAFEMPAPRQRVKSTKASSRNSTTAKSNPSSRSNSFTASESNTNIPTTISATEMHRQQQKSINERLQEQIQENIRLQEEIVRKLQQTDQQLLMSSNAVNNNNVSTTGMSQQQQYDQLTMFMNSNDFGSNITGNNNVSLGGHGMISQNAIMSSSTATRNSGTALSTGISNPLSFPQQQHQQSQQFNTTSNPNPLPFQQHQPLQQPSFLPDVSNSMYNDVDSVRNHILLQQQQQQQQQLQQQQQQQQQAMSFGGVNSQFQQNQYNALLQQQQLMSLPNLQGSIPGITSSNNNLGMGQQHQHILQNFANSNTAFTQQQQVAMQMQLMNRSIPSTMPNLSAAQQTQLQMNSLSENSAISNISLPSTTANTTQQQPTNEQNLDANAEPLDALDWWK